MLGRTACIKRRQSELDVPRVGFICPLRARCSSSPLPTHGLALASSVEGHAMRKEETFNSKGSVIRERFGLDS